MPLRPQEDIDMSPFARAAMTLAATMMSFAPVQAQVRPREPVGALAQRPLSLQEAVAIASGDQPALEAYQREAAASEQAAVAAEALPDLQLTAGIQNFPIRGDNAFNPIDDFMTMYTIGVMREQVRRSKRQAQAARIRADALVSRSQASVEDRQIKRNVMIAWIDAAEAEAKQSLLRRMIEDLQGGQRTMEAAVQTGASTPALALQMEAEIALEEAELASATAAEAKARARMARWIGTAAERPLADAVPEIELPSIVPADALAITTHPSLQLAEAERQRSLREAAVAREERKPDISWSVMLGVRQKYGEMVSGTVSIPLQLNRRNRQDRLVAEAELRASAAALRAEDTRRELTFGYSAALAEYRGAEAELARINKDAVPALEAAFKSAEARYAAGGGTLEKPFEIVRDYIETGIKVVAARARQARAAAEIIYIVGETGR
jgi:outer membrane protein TolC